MLLWLWWSLLWIRWPTTWGGLFRQVSWNRASYEHRVDNVAYLPQFLLKRRWDINIDVGTLVFKWHDLYVFHRVTHGGGGIRAGIRILSLKKANAYTVLQHLRTILLSEAILGEKLIGTLGFHTICLMTNLDNRRLQDEFASRFVNSVI
jgi:hypothetical protein